MHWLLLVTVGHIASANYCVNIYAEWDSHRGPGSASRSIAPSNAKQGVRAFASQQPVPNAPEEREVAEEPREAVVARAMVDPTEITGIPPTGRWCAEVVVIWPHPLHSPQMACRTAARTNSSSAIASSTRSSSVIAINLTPLLPYSDNASPLPASQSALVTSARSGRVLYTLKAG